MRSSGARLVALAESRARVLRLLAEILDDPAIADFEGSDLFIAFGSARVGVGVVQVDADDPPLVRIWSPLVVNVPQTTELLDQLNYLTADLGVGRFYWSDSAVIGETTLVAETIDAFKLGGSIKLLGQLADTHDDRLQGTFGGRLPAAS